MYSSIAINEVYLSDTSHATQYHMNFYNKLRGGKKKHTSKYHACICNLLLIGKHEWKQKICFNICY